MSNDTTTPSRRTVVGAMASGTMAMLQPRQLGAGADGGEDLCAGARRLARRLVLATGLRLAGEARPQGVRADHDRAG